AWWKGTSLPQRDAGFKVSTIWGSGPFEKGVNMVEFDRYTSARSIASDTNTTVAGRTTPTTVSSAVCGDTIAYTVTATASLGC
ncbi:hypothetical protein ABRP93_07935, partial [Corynebacterium sp. KPL2850]|uniref:hypothetical protein n=1 Tax=Corynebacterium sp. KPL2850 TaxID=3158318 RepID=UPI0032EBD761